MKTLVMIALLFSVITIVSVEAVHVSIFQNGYMICINEYQSRAVFRNPRIADRYADIAAQQLMRQIGVSSNITGHIAHGGTYLGLRHFFADQIRYESRLRQGGAFCRRYRANFDLIRFMLNDLTMFTDGWAMVTMGAPAVAAQKVNRVVTDIIKVIENSQPVNN